jgi:hypothetical protein
MPGIDNTDSTPLKSSTTRDVYVAVAPVSVQLLSRNEALGINNTQVGGHLSDKLLQRFSTVAIERNK